MSGILRLESLTKGNTLKQGDKTPLKYRLFDADGEKLNIAGKTAKVRLVYPDFLTIGYEKDGLTVAQDDTVTFTIDGVIPSRIYHVEIIVDDKFIFPSRSDESKFTVDKSSLGAETNIIEIVGKDVLIREVKSQVDAELQPLVTSLESAQQAETQRVSNETVRVSAEAQRVTDHANRSAELERKADKVVIKNEIVNGDFSDGLTGWVGRPSSVKIIDNRLYNDGTNTSLVNVHYPRVVKPNNAYYYGVTAEIITTIRPPLLSLGAVTSSTLSIDKLGLHKYSMVTNSGVSPNGNFSLDIYETEGYFDDFMLINLTETFGEGNEPTKEEMDELIKITGYIDGEYALNNKEMLGYLMNSKANKKQEDWITPTLLNGATGDIKFRKNQFGRVEFRGSITGSESGWVFTLPTGYQPLNRFRTLAKNGDGGITARSVIITEGGQIYFGQPYGTSKVYFDAISFSAN